MVLAHRSVCLGIFVPVIGSVIGPLLVLFMRGSEWRGVEAEATEAFNFGATLGAAQFIATLCAFFLGGPTIPLATNLFTFPVSLIGGFMALRAGHRAKKMIAHRYFLNFRPVNHIVVERVQLPGT